MSAALSFVIITVSIILTRYHHHHHYDQHKERHLSHSLNSFNHHSNYLIVFIVIIVSIISSAAHHNWRWAICIGYKYTFLAWVSASSSLPAQTSGVRCHGNIPAAVASFLQKSSWEILQFLAINNDGQVPASRLSLFAFGINLVFPLAFGGTQAQQMQGGGGPALL